MLSQQKSTSYICSINSFPPFQQNSQEKWTQIQIRKKERKSRVWVICEKRNACIDNKQPQQGTRNQLQAAGRRPGVRDLAYDAEHAQGPSVSFCASLPSRIHLIHQAQFPARVTLAKTMSPPAFPSEGRLPLRHSQIQTRDSCRNKGLTCHCRRCCDFCAGCGASADLRTTDGRKTSRCSDGQIFLLHLI